jgi:hypothetical protein
MSDPIDPKAHTIQSIEQAKEQLDKALERVKNPAAQPLSDFELGKITSASSALLDINGVC